MGTLYLNSDKSEPFITPSTKIKILILIDKNNLSHQVQKSKNRAI